MDYLDYESTLPDMKRTFFSDFKLSPAEVARMNKVQAVKTLLLGDRRKAQAISDFVKTMFMRDIIPVDDLSTQNCLYEAWLQQISNSDFMYNPDSGESYSPLDLRMQLLYNMSVDYEQYYPQVKMHLEIPYKHWIMKQLSKHTPSDMVAVAALRHMFQVSTYFKIFLPCVRYQEEVS